MHWIGIVIKGVWKDYDMFRIHALNFHVSDNVGGKVST